MDSCMDAGLSYSTLETCVLPAYRNLPSSWQLLVLGAIFVWLIVAQLTAVTKHVRSLVQPFVLRRVEREVPVLLAIQKYRNPQLDSFMGILACLVSIEFYALVLPSLFWFGHSKLSRQLTIMMAVCLYVGNLLKDVVCAPRPPSPVCRVVSSGTEETSAAEYGLPSSHTINIICFAGYVLHHLAGQEMEPATFVSVVALFAIVTSLVIFGRLYLGMHSPIDVLAGCAIGTSVLITWCSIDEYMDAFITSGENVVSFWAAISILALYAYPIPECPTPSFHDHTAFNGVAFGIVAGVHRTYTLFHAASDSPTYFSPDMILKTALGIAIIVVAKEGSKYLATILLPFLCYLVEPLLGFRFQSSSYVKSMQKKEMQKGEAMDVDTGIRFVQYATLGWAVVELVPHILSRLSL